MLTPSYLRLLKNDEPLVDLLNGTYGEVEETAWRLDDDIELSPESCKALLEAHKIARESFSKGSLEAFGLDPTLPGTGELMGHERRVAIFSLAIADEMEKRSYNIVINIRELALGALLHDSGKLKQRIQEIVCSNERLEKNDHRWEYIRKHPQIGHDFIMEMKDIPEDIRERVAQAVLHHHERMDGKGYYQEKVSPFEARVITIADALDVMTFRGGYQTPKPLHEALKIIETSDDQFHPKIAVAALAAFSMKSGKLTYPLASPSKAKIARQKVRV